MGVLMTSLIAVILTVAGLLTTQNWSKAGSTLKEGHNYHQRPVSSISPILYELKSPYNSFRKRNSISRVARYDGYSGYFDSYSGGGISEKSDFYYILPILLVIGLGSFLIPIISTFFTALVTSSGAIGGIGGCCGRRKRRHMKPVFSIETIYDVWDAVEKAIEKLSNNFDVK